MSCKQSFLKKRWPNVVKHFKTDFDWTVEIAARIYYIRCVFKIEFQYNIKYVSLILSKKRWLDIVKHFNTDLNWFVTSATVNLTNLIQKVESCSLINFFNLFWKIIYLRKIIILTLDLIDNLKMEIARAERVWI